MLDLPAPTRRDFAFGLPVAVIAGVLVGTLGTFKHQVGVSLATGRGFPTGLVLALAMVAVFLLAVRLGFPSRWFAVAAAIGVVAAVLVLSRPGPGGSVVIPANTLGSVSNTLGSVWGTAPALIALLVIALPLPRRRVPAGRPADGILDADPPLHPGASDLSAHHPLGDDD